MNREAKAYLLGIANNRRADAKKALQARLLPQPYGKYPSGLRASDFWDFYWFRRVS